MRLPRSKIWRAFKELDQFSDEQCKLYVREARRRSWRSLWVARPMLSFAVFVVTFFVLVFGFRAANEISWRRGGPGSSDLPLFVGFVLLLVWLISPIVTLILTRDLFLSRAVRCRLDTTECGGCGYNLLGLTPYDDDEIGRAAVRCPECGTRTPIGEGGIDAASLMAAVTATHPPTSTTTPPI